MLSPVFMREEEDLGRLAHEKLVLFRESKKDSELARLSTYGAQEKVNSRNFSDEKVKAMLLALEVMLLAAEVMLLYAEVMLLHAEVMLLHALKECMEI
ncbi:MAG: hypothetical protein J5914_02870 [Prevotella sp.]|nr:hypothetical protein [Prevotella sp.]